MRSCVPAAPTQMFLPAGDRGRGRACSARCFMPAVAPPGAPRRADDGPSGGSCGRRASPGVFTDGETRVVGASCVAPRRLPRGAVAVMFSVLDRVRRMTAILAGAAPYLGEDTRFCAPAGGAAGCPHGRRPPDCWPAVLARSRAAECRAGRRLGPAAARCPGPDASNRCPGPPRGMSPCGSATRGGLEGVALLGWCELQYLSSTYSD